MSIVHPLRSAPRQALDEDAREARSVVVHACSVQWRWQVGLGLVLLTVAVTLSWWLLELSDRVSLMDKAFQHAPPLPPLHVRYFALGGSFLCVLNAGLLFFCASGLRYFVDSRLVLDLHAAMRRLRWLWRIFGMSVALVTGAVAWAVFTGGLPLLK